MCVEWLATTVTYCLAWGPFTRHFPQRLTEQVVCDHLGTLTLTLNLNLNPCCWHSGNPLMGG
jgi:hypothetical protein